MIYGLMLFEVGNENLTLSLHANTPQLQNEMWSAHDEVATRKRQRKFHCRREQFVMFEMIYAASNGKIKCVVMTLTIVRLYLIIPFMTLHTIAVITQLNT